MNRGLLFWILMILWVLSLLGVVFEVIGPKYGYVTNVFLLVLFALLGWDVYGPALKGK
jgi:predicted membrane channel-forming protein YqfA (hemolysin III family)